MSGNLFTHFRAGFSASAPFLTTVAGGCTTYGDMLAATAQLAGLLRKRGVTPGARVAVQVEKSEGGLLLYLACLRVGAIYLPLNPAYTDAEIGYFLKDAEPHLFVCDPARSGTLEKVAAEASVSGVETLDPSGEGSLATAAPAMPADFKDVAVGPNDTAAILYTSGTTGRSKGAVLTHDNLRDNADALVGCWRFTSSDVLLHALPIFHTHGLFVATNVTLAAGGSMLLMPRFDAADVLAALPRATVMMGVPTFYTRLLAQAELTRTRVANIRVFISGSAPLTAETHKAFRECTGHAILERYGMTETNMITSNPYDGERRPGSVGMPLPGMALRIADPETGRVLPIGEAGVIEVCGPSVFAGYWRNPEKTKAEFRDDGYFITGDVGRVSPDGYVSIVGRAKDLVISGGLNVYPSEVETLLDAMPEIAESAVIGVPHADFGEAVTAVVVGRKGSAADEETVRQRLAVSLAKFKVPKRVVFVDQLPRNVTGKIQKNVLRETYRDLYAEPVRKAGHG